jgi:toxin ParE1/3/4
MPIVHVTRRAFNDLEAVSAYSAEHWGRRVAEAYLDELYGALQQIANDPARGAARRHRSHPYLMASIGKHFAIYESTDDGIIVAAILHGRRDVERIIAQLSGALAMEVQIIRDQLTRGPASGELSGASIVPTPEAQERLDELVDDALAGKTIFIAEPGLPLVHLKPLTDAERKSLESTGSISGRDNEQE